MQTLKFLKEYWAIIGALCGIATSTLGIFLVGAWVLFSDPVVEFIKEEVGVNELNATVAELRTFVGADRLISQPLGQSYVIEPVYVGEPINAVVKVFRTDKGSACTFLGGSTIFTSSTGLTFTGADLRPKIQLNTTPQALIIQATPDQELEPGRYTLQLQLRYKCQDIERIELTYPMVFFVFERR